MRVETFVFDGFVCPACAPAFACEVLVVPLVDGGVAFVASEFVPVVDAGVALVVVPVVAGALVSPAPLVDGGVAFVALVFVGEFVSAVPVVDAGVSFVVVSFVADVLVPLVDGGAAFVVAGVVVPVSAAVAFAIIARNANTVTTTAMPIRCQRRLLGCVEHASCRDNFLHRHMPPS